MRRRFSRKIVLTHLGIWVMINVLLSLAALNYTQLSGGAFGQKFLTEWVWMCFNLPYAYGIAYLFVPRLLLRNKKLLFVLVLIGWFVLFMLLQPIFYLSVLMPLVFHQHPGWAAFNAGQAFSVRSSFILNSLAAVFSAMSLFEHYQIESKRALEIELETTAMELQSLRAQLRPSFLFDIMDHLYAQVTSFSPAATGIVLSFSHLLRYMLYDCHQQRVPLEQELNAIRQYLQLEQARRAGGIDCSLTIAGSPEGKVIPPMLLLLFTERALRRKPEADTGPPWVSIDIRVGPDRLRLKLTGNLPFADTAGTAPPGEPENPNSIHELLHFHYGRDYVLQVTDFHPIVMVVLDLPVETAGSPVSPPVSLNTRFQSPSTNFA